jgi:hypothetical protein
VSSSRQKAIVSRTYKPIPDRCADALKLLLMKPVITEGSPSLAALEDDVKESNGYVATENHSK